MTTDEKLNFIMGMISALALGLGGVIGKVFNLI